MRSLLPRDLWLTGIRYRYLLHRATIMRVKFIYDTSFISLLYFLCHSKVILIYVRFTHVNVFELIELNLRFIQKFQLTFSAFISSRYSFREFKISESVSVARLCRQ